MPGAPLAVMVGLVTWTITAGSARGWALSMPWSASPTFHDDSVRFAASEAWHAVYLPGMAGLAALAALLRHRRHRFELFPANAVIAAATMTAGILQLP